MSYFLPPRACVHLISHLANNNFAYYYSTSRYFTVQQQEWSTIKKLHLYRDILSILPFTSLRVAILVTYFGILYCSNPAVGLQQYKSQAGLGKLLVIELFYLPRGWVSYWSKYFISIVTPLFLLRFYVAILVTIFGTL